MKRSNFSKYITFNWLAHKINNDSLIKQLPNIKGMVVDLGCGEKPYELELLNKADKYFGVDWKLSLHDQSKVDVYVDLRECLPFMSGCADSVVSFQVMEHLPEPKIFLSEAFRILKSGGTIIVTVPFMWHVHEAPQDYYRFTKHGLQYLLNITGFEKIEVLENTGFWQMWVLKFNYHTSRKSRGPLKYFWIPIWLVGQLVSPIVDKIDRHPQETASYTVLARKL